MQWPPHLVCHLCQCVYTTLASHVKWARDRSQDGGLNVAQVDTDKGIEKVYDNQGEVEMACPDPTPIQTSAYYKNEVDGSAYMV